MILRGFTIAPNAHLAKSWEFPPPSQLHSSFEFLTADTVSKEHLCSMSHYRSLPSVKSKIEHYGKFVKAKFDFEKERKEKYRI